MIWIGQDCGGYMNNINTLSMNIIFDMQESTKKEQKPEAMFT